MINSHEYERHVLASVGTERVFKENDGSLDLLGEVSVSAIFIYPITLLAQLWSD